MKKSLLLLCFFWSFTSARLFAQDQTVPNGTAATPVNFAGAGCAFTWTNDQPSIGLPASGSGNIGAFNAINTTGSPIVATISVTPVPIVFAYIPNYFSNTVSVVNTVTNIVVATIRVGNEPVAVSVSPDGSRVYVANFQSQNISVISTATNTVIATIPIGDDVNWVVVNHAGTKVYVASFSAIKIIDVATNTVVGSIPAVGVNCVVIDATDNFAFTTSNTSPGTVQKIDLVANTVVGSATVGIFSWAVTISPDGNQLYVTNTQSNDVTVLNASDLSTIATIPVGNSPTIVVFSLDGQTAWVTDNTANTITVIDPATNTVTGTIACGGISMGINLSADGKILFVTVGNTLKAISTSTNTILSTVPVGNTPLANGNFLTPPACNSNASTFTITVNPTSSISVSTVEGYIAACAGTASSTPAIQQFKVNAIAATGNITATAPAGFEVSLSLNSGYGSGVTLTPAAGVINNQPVYIRSAATAPAGAISGNITLTGGGGADQSIGVTGFISSPATVVQVPDQIVQNGALTAAVNFTGTGNTFTWTNDMPGIGLTADSTGNIPSFTAINTGTTPIVATISVITKNAGFAYVGATTGNAVTVINTSTYKVVGSIGVGSGPYGMWQTPNGGLLYVANNQSNTVSVINMATQAVIATIAVPGGPAGLIGSADGSTLYVVEEFGGAVAVINTATQTVTTNIPVGSVPEAICISLDGTTLYVTNTGDNDISVISTATNTVTATISVGSVPQGICISPDGTKLYEVNGLDNNLYVISTVTNTVIGTIPVGTQPHNVTISADGNTVYTANQGTDSTISVVNTATGTVTATIPVGSFPDGVALSPDGSTLWVTNLYSSDAIAINTATNTVANIIPVGPFPGSLGNFVSNGGCPSQPMTFTITINPTAPTITVTGTLSPMTTVYGTPSNSENFTISGSNLTAGVLVIPPPGFEVSTDGVTFSTSVTLANAITVSPTTIYIRLAATTPVSSYAGDINISSIGATTQYLAVPASTVTPAPLTITAADTSRPFGQPNPVFTFVYSGFQNNETAAALVTAPQGATTATVTSPAGDYPIIPAAAEDSNYSFIYQSGTLKITPVITAPSIIVTGTLLPMATIYGTPSTSDAFTISGSNLTAGVLFTPPTGFEVSADGVSFNSTVTIGGAVSVPPTMIYIRLAAATPVSSYEGNITIISNGAAAQDLAIPASTVAPAPLTITVQDETRPFGQPNPVFTFTYSGFQNGETEAQLIVQPLATTTATESSPAGDYPIIAAGAKDSNYSFTYQPATLKIIPASMAVSVPNAFTPNGDGKNDTWGIKNLSTYTKCRVTVFNRYGQAIFTSIGYSEPWNGRQNGNDIPGGTYVYIIDLRNNTRPMTGTVMIIR